ncbi:acidic mammalian chitinase-like [Periplaneta americana]|uniref:acidic mammalian chitinase-like n=1 Tax=Periplaneta americana TaxID=6978 RepID=UPI0037E950D9
MHLWLFIFGTVLALSTGAAVAQKKVVCYLGSWSTYRPGDGKFDIEHINPHLCTHVIYTFVGITSAGGIRILDDWNEIGKGGFRRFNELRNQNPSLKTLVAIGGWNEGSTTYSQVVNSASLRSAFVNNIVNFVKQYEFDGFDLDWEYPCQRGGASTDKAAYILLLKELREKFDQNGYLLSAAVAAAESSASLSYDIPKVGQYLDFINIMAYDLHGSWDSVTGHNAPLYPSSKDVTQQQRSLNVDAAVKYWLGQGAPPEKIVVGMGTYGRTFTLSGSASCAIGVPASGAGSAGPYTREAGMLGYNEICEKLSSWNVIWDDEQKVPFACNGNQFVGYDNPKSIGLKAQYVVSKGLGGAMIWSLETDDFLGKCHGSKFPLLRAINEVFNGGVLPPDEDTTTTTTTTIKTPENPDIPTDPPVTSAPEPETPGVCTKEGHIRDPNNCEIFYHCQSDGSGGFIAHQKQCSNGLLFDPVLQVCNWPSAVSC